MKTTTLALVLLTGLLSACSENQLGTSLELDRDPVLRRQAAGSTLVGSADLRALRGSPTLRAQLRCAGIDLDAEEHRLRTATGVERAQFDLQQLGLGCGPGGCALLGRGAVTPQALPALGAAALAPGAAIEQAGPTALHSRLPRGEPVRLQLDRDGWLLGGDRDAVAALDADAERLDPSPLAGAVPAGALWLAGFAPERLFTDAARRLERHGAPGALELAGLLRSEQGGHRLATRLAETVALSLSLQPQPTLRLRMRARSPRLAVEAAIRLRAMLLYQRLRPGQDPRARALLKNAEVLRAGRLVEVAAPLPDLCPR